MTKKYSILQILTLFVEITITKSAIMKVILPKIVKYAVFLTPFL